MKKVTITITKKTSQHEAKRLFREMVKKSNPEESLDALIEELKQFEEKFGMSTVELYRHYLAGRMGDSKEVMHWAGIYKLYTHLIETYFQPKAEAK